MKRLKLFTVICLTAGGSSGNMTANYDNTVNGIYITLKSGQSKSDFLDKLITTSANSSDKVGQGYADGQGKFGAITEDIHWYDSSVSEINGQ